MALNAQLKSLVNQMPDPGGNGMYTENIDKEKIEKAVAQIAAGGRRSCEGLIEMLGELGSPENVKPHYALHCALNHTLVAGDDKARREFCDAMALKLAGPLSTYNKAYLCQELGWAGDRAVTQALGKLLLDEELVEPATMALVAIGDGAAEQFRSTLPKAEGKCRLNVVHGLATVSDVGSADALRKALSDSDTDVRITAGWGLARMGDAGAVDALLNAADVGPGWERIQATKHCLVLAEKLMQSGKKDVAVKIYTRLRDARKDPSEQYIREAAEKALSAAQV